MRTTLEIDDDVLAAAKELARERSVSIGTLISELARAGLRPSSVEVIDGWPVIRATPESTVITSDMVARAQDD